MTAPILTLKNLSIAKRSPLLHYFVHDLSLTLHPGESLALVGESGSGKSLTALAIMGLLPNGLGINSDSKIFFENIAVHELSRENHRNLRRKGMAMIFQDPQQALDPVFTIGQQINEILWDVPRKKREVHSAALLEEVALSDPVRVLKSYPHELSGGMRQRIMIALALALNPKLIIADEPTTALDVITQAKILEVLITLTKQKNVALLLITHDLKLVAPLANRVGILYAGKLIESGSAHAILEKPLHPYAQGLLASVPSVETHGQALYNIKGTLPASSANTSMCRFLDRCAHAKPICYKMPVPIQTYPVEDRQVLCHLNQIPLLSYEHITREDVVFSRSILTVQNLSVAIKRTLLEGITFNVFQGETLAIVGASGSGKSTLARAILRLVPIVSGEIFLENIPWHSLPRKRLRDKRHEMQMVFQDPFASLDPKQKLQDAFEEALERNVALKSRAEQETFLRKLLDNVSLPWEVVHKFPHEFSGGQRQRLCIVRALCTGPRLLILDEPTSALDVSVQAQILNTLEKLKRSGLTMVLITHHLGVVAHLADRVMVLEKGRIIEIGETKKVLSHPKHPVTASLVQASL